MEQCKIDRINELTRLSRERDLTDTETAERQILRREYVDACKASLKSHLGCIRIADETGTTQKPGE
jgi:uncharacterized protein YnzC (UPF0291/DUF896 family)